MKYVVEFEHVPLSQVDGLLRITVIVLARDFDWAHGPRAIEVAIKLADAVAEA